MIKRYLLWSIPIALILVVLFVIPRSALRDLAYSSIANPDVQSEYVSTVLQTVRLDYHRRTIPLTTLAAGGSTRSFKSWGGAISELGENYLLASGDGRLYEVVLGDPDERIEVSELNLRVPVNIDDFYAVTVDESLLKTFRVADVLIQEIDGALRLFASHHYWDVEQRCSVVRISSVSGTYKELTAESSQLGWTTIFQSQPCLPFKDRAVKFGGLQIGGKMSLLDSDTILIVLGDHEFDGYYGIPNLPQKTDNSYGKSIRVPIDGGEASIFTLGHRNPSGLFIDRTRTIWSTEHGPKGGDELNVLNDGGDYGWPVATYGTAYDRTNWPLSGDNRHHSGFVQPKFAWLPSIGISNLVRLSGDEFSVWRDDLMVASLTNRNLWRVRIVDNRVVYTESIRVGCRIRDLLETRSGQLLLWCDNARTLVRVSRPNADDNGELLFAQCEACHSLDWREEPGIGPDLRAVAGRKIASKNGFVFSTALQARGNESWNDANLDAFLKNPQEFAPGTTMQFPGLPDARRREALIQFIKSVD